MKTQLVTIATTAGILLLSGVAVAQVDTGERSGDSDASEFRPVQKAVELTVGSGYSQGIGDVAADRALSDLSQAGGAVQVGASYRLIPQLALGVYGSGAMFDRGDVVSDSADLFSATAGVQADWHFRPDRQIDPWVSLGTGWRGYWISEDRGTTSLQGLEIAKLQVGTDFRFTRDVALSPVVGADASVFLTERAPGDSGYAAIGSPRVNTFLFGGVQGRFDIATDRGSSSAAGQARTVSKNQ